MFSEKAPTDFDRLRKAKVLITGGLGFIGSNLAERLVRLGAEVTLLDSMIPEYGGNLRNVHGIQQRVRINISDVRDAHALRYLVQGQDILFNLAGQTSHLDSMEHPRADLDINAAAQLSILETCRHCNPGIKVVFASTRQIYGRPDRLPVDETHPLRPVDVNGINKLAGEMYHLLYHQVYGIRTVVLRLTNTYGPRMRVKDARQTFLGIWIRRVIEGSPILVYGDGQQLRDFNYVDDVVDALVLAATRETAYGEVYNLGCDQPVTLQDTAKILIDLYGRGSLKLVPFPEDRKSIDIGDYYGDYTKIRAQLGWTPRVALRDGLMKTLAYYTDHAEYYWSREAA
ncbi:MAG: NAD-dependent epimerase/dehydratase family protein [Nitrospiraceae bacterium]